RRPRGERRAILVAAPDERPGRLRTGRLAGNRLRLRPARLGCAWRWLERPMSRILGLDLGEKRIGVAVADDDGMATPLTTLRRAAAPTGDADAIARLLAEQGATEIVVGLPLEAAGQEGPQARITREWVDAVRPHLD